MCECGLAFKTSGLVKKKKKQTRLECRLCEIGLLVACLALLTSNNMAEHNSWSTTTIKPFPKASCVIFGKDMGIPSPKELWAIYIVDKRKLNSVPPIFLKTPTYPFYLLPLFPFFLSCNPFPFFSFSHNASLDSLSNSSLLLELFFLQSSKVHNKSNSTLQKSPFFSNSLLCRYVLMHSH